MNKNFHIQRQFECLPAPAFPHPQRSEKPSEGEEIVLPAIAQSDPKRFACCLQQAQRFLSADSSMQDAVQFVDGARSVGLLAGADEMMVLACSVGLARPIEQVLQRLCAEDLSQQYTRRQRRLDAGRREASEKRGSAP